MSLRWKVVRYWDLVRTNQAKDFIKGWDRYKEILTESLSRRLISRMAIWYRTLISKN